MNIFEEDWYFVKNTLIVGDFKEKPEILKQLREHIHKKYINIQDLDLTPELLDKLLSVSSEEYTTVFQQNKPNEERKHTYVEINQTFLVENSEKVSVLLSESRPLKLIIIITIDDLTSLPQELRNVITGNTANYIIGGVNKDDKTLLEEVLTSKQLFDSNYNYIVSTLSQDLKRSTQKVV